MAFIHPQKNMEFPHEFGGKPIKMWRMMTFGKQISKLIMSRDELNQQITLENLFTKKMIINLNVLGLSMKHRIRCNSQSTNIITPKKRRKRKENTKITKKHPNPIQFNSSGCQSTIFYLCG